MNNSDPNTSEMHRSPTRPAVPRRRLWIGVLLSLVIFVSGGLAGMGTTLIVSRNRVLYAIHHPEQMPSLIAARMRGKLNLSEEQVLQVETILGRRQLAIQAIRRQFQPQVERELDRVEEEIAQVLDDQQRARWHEHFGQLRHTWIPEPPPAPRDGR
jgi:hypothetical protein